MSGYYRFVCAVPQVVTADIRHNVSQMAELFCQASENGAAAVLFPAQSLGGYSCGRLEIFPHFLKAEKAALQQLAEVTEKYPSLLVCGTSEGKVAVISSGVIHYTESDSTVFTDGNIRISCALPYRRACDMVSNSGGAHVVLFPYAGTDTFFSVNARRQELAVFSRMLNAYCIACGAGASNTTSSGVCAGQALAAFDGKVTAENRHFTREPQLLCFDVDFERAEYLRRQDMQFWNNSDREIAVTMPTVDELKYAPVSKYPFIPEDESELHLYAESIVKTSACALANRMVSSRSKKMVLGVSGGLDSTMALITCIECCKELGLSNDAVVAVSMPGFGTSDRTRDNSLAIAREFGTELKYIPIADAVNQHFKDIGHDPADTNVVYENSQARERTQILMDIANQCGGIVIGTGDLSEIALGWCTYNGDQMSMYAVNASIPKTLMRQVIKIYAAACDAELRSKLLDICDTPVSPELVPGKQFTEEIIGSYDLHDFFLYNFVRYGDTPEKLLAQACRAFAGVYGKEQILNSLETFFRRFFISQFKRTAMPDAPNVTGIMLTADFMPSDAGGKLWLDQINELKKQVK